MHIAEQGILTLPQGVYAIRTWDQRNNTKCMTSNSLHYTQLPCPMYMIMLCSSMDSRLLKVSIDCLFTTKCRSWFTVTPSKNIYQLWLSHDGNWSTGRLKRELMYTFLKRTINSFLGMSFLCNEEKYERICNDALHMFGLETHIYMESIVGQSCITAYTKIGVRSHFGTGLDAHCQVSNITMCM